MIYTDKCDLGRDCHCVTRGVRDDGFHFDQEKMDKCDHYDRFTPALIQANCALGKHCDCADRKMRHTFDMRGGGAKPWLCPNWGRSSLSSPPIITSKQDRLRTTRQAWDKRRDKMMREAERRMGKLNPQGEIEEKLREIRHNPIKHLERKGVRQGLRRKPI